MKSWVIKKHLKQFNYMNIAILVDFKGYSHCESELPLIPVDFEPMN